MIALTLVFAAVAVACLIIAIRGLSGSWPMQVASFLALAGWMVALVWALVVGVQLLNGPPDDVADGFDALAAYLLVWSFVSGLGLAFLALVKCGPPVVPRLFHALGLGGLVAAVVALALPTGAEDPTWAVVLAVVLPVLWGLAWLIPYLLLRGSVDPARYAAAPAGFRLPFPGGRRTWVIQGNSTSFNHTQGNFTQDFAWDFRRGCGTPVLAAEAGRVTSVIDNHDGIGGPNNEIEVEHADGSVASYLHIKRGSARVAVGAAVSQGDQLAEVGSVGHSLTGHIHFHVRAGGVTVPVKFADVTRHDGIPRGFRFYTSGNARPPGS